MEPCKAQKHYWIAGVETKNVFVFNVAWVWLLSLLGCLACFLKYVFVLRCQSTGLLVFLACLFNCLTCLLVCLFAYVVVCLASHTAVTMHKRSVSFFEGPLQCKGAGESEGNCTCARVHFVDRWRRRHPVLSIDCDAVTTKARAEDSSMQTSYSHSVPL